MGGRSQRLAEKKSVLTVITTQTLLESNTRVINDRERSYNALPVDHNDVYISIVGVLYHLIIRLSSANSSRSQRKDIELVITVSSDPNYRTTLL